MFFLGFVLILYVPSTIFSYKETSLSGLNEYKVRINVSCSKTQSSDASEARTQGPSVLSQTLYHWATVLPIQLE